MFKIQKKITNDPIKCLKIRKHVMMMGDINYESILTFLLLFFEFLYRID